MAFMNTFPIAQDKLHTDIALYTYQLQRYIVSVMIEHQRPKGEHDPSALLKQCKKKKIQFLKCTLTDNIFFFHFGKARAWKISPFVFV